jgi:hypothetical protein
MSNKKDEKKEKELDLVAEEKNLVEKYSDQKIKKGSLAEAGKFPHFGNKRTIVIHCQSTGEERRIATSDLHQVKYSEKYMKQLRLERRKEMRKSENEHKPRKAAKVKRGRKRKSAEATV